MCTSFPSLHLCIVTNKQNFKTLQIIKRRFDFVSYLKYEQYTASWEAEKVFFYYTLYLFLVVTWLWELS